MLLLPKDLPKHECIRAIAEQHPTVDPSALESYLWLLRLASDVVVASEHYFATFGLSQARFTVLMLLRRAAEGAECGAATHGPAVRTPSDLAEDCGVSRATMTGLLDGLERDGLVARGRPSLPEEGDRRSVAVRLTDRGRCRLDELLPGYFSLVSDLMKGLDEPGRTHLADLLRRLRAGSPALATGPTTPAAGALAKEAV